MTADRTPDPIGEPSAGSTREIHQETMLINMGPQHPSTHGVLRLLLELDGETVLACTPIIGYLHTGIEKNTEYRTWQQGVTFVTRADYLAPFFNELGYCLAVEKLLGIEAPPRAQVLRVMFCEMNRIASHLVWLATSGLELGAVSVMLYGFREREQILDIFEAATGLRMNHAYVRIGGVVMDLPEGGLDRIGDFLRMMPGRIDEYESLLTENPIWIQRNQGVGLLSAEDALTLRRDRPDPAGRRRGAGRAARRAVRRLRDLRLRRRHERRGRLLRPVPGPDGGDAPVPADRRAVPRPPARTRPGDGRGPEGALAGAARGRTRRHRELAPLRHPHHGGVDGGPDPSLQDGDRGRLRPAGRGLRAGGVPARRARVLRRLRRREPPRTA